MSPLHFRPRPVLVAAFAILVAGGCGPGELATPSAPQAERLISATFPDARIRVREVSRAERSLRIPAEFNEADVIFLMSAGEQEWTITGVEQGGNTYTVEQLGQIAATMTIMRSLSDSLEAYRETTGGFPLLDDLVGLRELVPEYYPAEAPMEDVWGSAFRYRLQGDDYTVTSTGPDRESGNSDDIILITGSFVEADG